MQSKVSCIEFKLASVNTCSIQNRLIQFYEEKEKEKENEQIDNH
mgnify:CR=1 FL=1